MPGSGPQWTDFLSCEVCYKLFTEHANRPISLGCGHTVCKLCLSHLQQNKCPFDQSIINCDIDKLPVNYALLQLIGAAIPDKLIDNEDAVGDISDAKKTECYESARKCIEELAIYLKPLSEDSLEELENNNEDLTDLKVKSNSQATCIQTRNGRTIAVNASSSYNAGCVLSRPMQRKLLVLINCQLVEEEGRSRAARAARSLGERTVMELILSHQNPQQLSANLWAAVRTRGCQFLGPGMQEEVLRLILLALEDGSALSRKVLVLFVVQRLEKQYPQASKTAIGHVVQLLYRASCFRVTKREDESSLMQLKEEFRNYENLRLEHDAQIVQIAMEAGLRISPEQWSSLLYGDALHKSQMQSIIDKHQNPQSFSQGISELMLVLQRQGDVSNLHRLRPHLDFLAKIDPSPECPAPSWEDMEAVMKSLKIVVQGLVDFLLHYNQRRPDMAPIQNTRYKTSMCRDFTAKNSCPRGATCTFAHSQEELDQYRNRAKNLSYRGTFGGLVNSPKHKNEPMNMENSSQNKNFNADGGAPNCSENNIGTLTSSVAGLSVMSGGQPSVHRDPQQSPVAPLFPPSPQPSSSSLSSTGMLPGVPPGLTRPQPGLRMPYNAIPGLNERLQPDHLPMPFPQGSSIRFHSPDLGVHYHNSSLTAHLPQSLPGAVSMPPNAARPLGDSMPPRVPCPHQVPADNLHPTTPPVYHLGMMMGRPMQTFPPDAPYVLGPGGDHPAMTASPVSAMQTLERLQNRKSELICHLQSEQVGTTGGGTARNKLDHVLSARPRPAVDVLSNSLNDTFVAMRTTNTLDELETDGVKGYPSKQDFVNVGNYPLLGSLKSAVTPTSGSAVSEASSHSKTLPVTKLTHSQAPLTTQSLVWPSTVSPRPSTNVQILVATTSDVYKDRDFADNDCVTLDIGLVTSSIEDEDDFFIPFDPPLVSRFGPISRNIRIRGRDTEPVQVTAEENTLRCTPVLSVTPLERPYPTSAPVPSLYKPQMSACPAPSISRPSALQPSSNSFYSPWSGQDFWRWQIPEMVHKLEKSAIQANTTSERLALQLQSVELQISMKTGANPKHVSQLLQEATHSKGTQRSVATSAMGCIYSVGEDAVHGSHRRDLFPEWK